MNTQRWMNSQFFSFFFTWGIFLPYWTGWLIHAKGLTVSEASLIMSLGLVVRGLSTLFIYPYFSEKWSNKMLLHSLAIGTFISLLLYIPTTSFTSILLATLLMHIIYPTLMPALDSVASTLIQNHQLKDYGKSRSYGSIGFVISGMILTFFTGEWGDKVILWAMLIGAFLLLLLNLLHTPTILSVKPKKEKRQSGSMFQLFNIQYFGLVMAIVILLQAAHASYYSYGYIFLQEIHAPHHIIGLILNIAVFAEIIFFALSDKYFHKFTVGSLLALSAFGSTVRWLLIFIFPNVFIFCLSQTLHALSFAMGHYAFMKYLIINISPSDIPKAQGIYSALALSWSTAVFTILGGYLYEIEPKYSFLGMILCSLPSMFLALKYRKVEVQQNFMEKAGV